jgi:LPXTG-site transpeptidase (sortase) family protein
VNIERRSAHDADIRRLVGLVIAAPTGLALSACGATHEPTLRSRAASYHHQLHRGQWLGRLVAPRLRASVAVRVGLGQPDIDSGPGWWPGSYLPGEGGVTYIAGHRLTHGGPFRWVGRLRIGDRVVLQVPYADAVYVVARRAFIPESRRTVVFGPRRDELRLQTSTVPPSHRRLIVFARASSVRARRGS